MLFRQNRVAVPRDLASVTSYDPARETDPADVGLKPDAARRIWSAVEAMYGSGLHPGVSITVRRHGRVILDRAIGHARGNAPGEQGEKQLLTPQTPVCLFSASKAISAMLIHKLAEQGKLQLDARVADYLPEYGNNGKEKTTLRQLLAHRAGIPEVPLKNVDPTVLNDFDTIVRLLCASKPNAAHGRQQSYHAVTAGYIAGAVAQRVSGRSLPELLRTELAEPLGCEYFRYGLAPEQQPRGALNAFTGPSLPAPVAMIAKRALYVDFEELAVLTNDPHFMESVVPAANIYSTAEESCRFYQMLLDGGVWQGRRIFKPETIAEAVRPAGPIQIDRTLLAPVRFSPAFVLGEWPFGLYGSNCPKAFGHLGFLNIICWADPDRDISVSLLNTGKTVAPDSLLTVARVLGAISRNCPRVKGR
ncbi:serine hydrolase domain-containing protein [Solimonas sp. K1W22B-7]|uniref:serine hydrolase domain-containing protein n=1 Tax=Solimonas sp. K1W22B-7 TaxID=2303331 RepID=UPI0013C4BB04|nr:serine hydrolase domain-containing protein [Solimonas sp. K1W22B-7]